MADAEVAEEKAAAKALEAARLEAEDWANDEALALAELLLADEASLSESLDARLPDSVLDVLVVLENAPARLESSLSAEDLEDDREAALEKASAWDRLCAAA